MTWVARHKRGLLIYAVVDVWSAVVIELWLRAPLAALVAWELQRAHLR